MIDDYLWLTPLLALGVLALVRFVGCDLVFAPQGHVALDPPANFVARPGNHRVDLSWDPVDDADGYRISRAEAPGPPYTTDFNVDGAQTTFTDSGLTNGVAEFYVIAATQDGDASVHQSPEVSATPGQGLVVSKTLGTLRNNFTGFSGMVIRIGPVPLTVVGIGRIFVAGNTGTHLLRIADGATGVDLPGGTVTIDFAAGGVPNEFSYATLAAPIVLTPNTEFLVLSQETNGGDQFFDLDTTVLTSAGASVVAAVFGDGVSPFIRGGGPGQSYGPVDVLF
jgi:hypothetical protein